MSTSYFDELREHFGTENWFVNAEAREKTKTNEQKILDKEFYWAVKDGNREFSVELFDKGATNDYREYDGWSALHWTCYKGDLNIAKKIIQKFPAELERKTTFFGGFITPIGIAFKGRQTEAAKWLLRIGAKNPIFQAVQSCDGFSFDIIHQTGRATEYISEDLSKIKELKVMTRERTLIGLRKLMKYYEMNEKTFATIVNILSNFKFENDPNGEKLWNEKIAEFKIINQWAIRNEKWDYFVENCTKTGGTGILEFVPRDLVPKLLAKVLNNWIKSYKKLLTEAGTLYGIEKLLKYFETDESNFTKILIILSNLEFEEITGKEKVVNLKIIKKWAIRKENRDFLIENCIQNETFGGLILLPKDLVPDSLSKILTSWRKTNQNVLMESKTMQDLEIVMKYFENDKLVLRKLLNVLFNTNFQNDLNKKKLWKENIHRQIVAKLPNAGILNEDYLRFEMCIQNAAEAKLRLTKDEILEIVSKVLHNLKGSSQKILDKIFDDLEKFLQLHEKTEEVFSTLIAAYEQFDVDQNDLLVKHSESTNQTLFKHILVFGYGKLNEDISQASNGTTGETEEIRINLIQKLCEACKNGDEKMVTKIIGEFTHILDEPIWDDPTPLSTAIQYSQWEIVKILLEKGAGNVIHNLIFANGTEIEVDLDIFFDVLEYSNCFENTYKWIETDLKNMTDLKLFSISRMRVGLARLFKFVERNKKKISKHIEDTLTDLKLMESEYIPELSLLWRYNGRFPVEYFWKRNITQKITLTRNNYEITVSNYPNGVI